MSLLLRSCRSTIKTLVQNMKPAVSVSTWQARFIHNNNNKERLVFIQRRHGWDASDDKKPVKFSELTDVQIIPLRKEVDDYVLDNLFVDVDKPDLFDCPPDDTDDDEVDLEYYQLKDTGVDDDDDV